MAVKLKISKIKHFSNNEIDTVWIIYDIGKVRKKHINSTYVIQTLVSLAPLKSKSTSLQTNLKKITNDDCRKLYLNIENTSIFKMGSMYNSNGELIYAPKFNKPNPFKFHTLYNVRLSNEKGFKYSNYFNYSKNFDDTFFPKQYLDDKKPYFRTFKDIPIDENTLKNVEVIIPHSVMLDAFLGKEAIYLLSNYKLENILNDIKIIEEEGKKIGTFNFIVNNKSLIAAAKTIAHLYFLKTNNWGKEMIKELSKNFRNKLLEYERNIELKSDSVEDVFFYSKLPFEDAVNMDFKGIYIKDINELNTKFVAFEIEKISWFNNPEFEVDEIRMNVITDKENDSNNNSPKKPTQTSTGTNPTNLEVSNMPSNPDTTKVKIEDMLTGFNLNQFGLKVETDECLYINGNDVKNKEGKLLEVSIDGDSLNPLNDGSSNKRLVIFTESKNDTVHEIMQRVVSILEENEFIINKVCLNDTGNLNRENIDYFNRPEIETPFVNGYFIYEIVTLKRTYYLIDALYGKSLNLIRHRNDIKLTHEEIKELLEIVIEKYEYHWSGTLIKNDLLEKEVFLLNPMDHKLYLLENNQVDKDKTAEKWAEKIIKRIIKDKGDKD